MDNYEYADDMEDLDLELDEDIIEENTNEDDVVVNSAPIAVPPLMSSNYDAMKEISSSMFSGINDYSLSNIPSQNNQFDYNLLNDFVKDRAIFDEIIGYQNCIDKLSESVMIDKNLIIKARRIVKDIHEREIEHEVLIQIRDMLFDTLSHLLLQYCSHDSIHYLILTIKKFIALESNESSPEFIIDNIVASVITARVVNLISTIKSPWIKMIIALFTFYFTRYLQQTPTAPSKEELTEIADNMMEYAIDETMDDAIKNLE